MDLLELLKGNGSGTEIAVDRIHDGVPFSHLPVGRDSFPLEVGGVHSLLESGTT